MRDLLSIGIITPEVRQVCHGFPPLAPVQVAGDWRSVFRWYPSSLPLGAGLVQQPSDRILIIVCWSDGGARRRRRAVPRAAARSAGGRRPHVPRPPRGLRGGRRPPRRRPSARLNGEEGGRGGHRAPSPASGTSSRAVRDRGQSRRPYLTLSPALPTAVARGRPVAGSEGLGAGAGVAGGGGRRRRRRGRRPAPGLPIPRTEGGEGRGGGGGCTPLCLEFSF